MQTQPAIRLLVVDDDPEIGRIVETMLASSKLATYHVTQTLSAQAAAEIVSRTEHDICLVDYNLNETLTGLDVIERAIAGNCPIPMILVTADMCEELDFDAMRCGAAGFIHKEDLTRSVLDRTLRYTMARAQHVQQIEHETDALKKLAHVDPLTGLPNRREFDLRLAAALTKGARAQTEFSLIFIDLDGFKNVNDSHGHDVGDGILRVIGARLLRELRGGDSLCRIGGDEFVAIVAPPQPGVAMDSVCKPLLERLTQRVHGEIGIGRAIVHIGASFGVATYPHDGTDAETLLKTADRNMYRDKQS